MKNAKIFSIITTLAVVGCFSAVAMQIGVATELVKQITEYESQISSTEVKEIKSRFERVSYVKSRWNNSAAYFALAAFIFLLIQQYIVWKHLEKET